MTIASKSTIIALAACLFLLMPTPALAILCDPPSIERIYEKSDWVFFAEVEKARNTYNEKDHRDHKSLQKLKLKILKVWKGTPPETMELEILTSKTVLIMASPTPLEAHQSYIFALSGKQTIAPYILRATGCASPIPATNAEKDILWLNNKIGE